MILEAATLIVDTGKAREFETAFEKGLYLIREAPGCRSLELRRCIENPGKYLLLIQWDRLEDHTERFCNSEGYRQWLSVVGEFFLDGTSVEHFSPQIGDWFTPG